MTTSDWGDWLPTAVAGADPGGTALWYLGCNGFVLKTAGGTTVWIDPYVGTGDPPRTVRMIPVPFDPGDVSTADAVLATHEHTDHVHGASQGPILANTGATMYGPDDSIALTEDWPAEFDVTESQFRTVDEGDALEVGDLTIHVEAATDPDATHPVSYVIEAPGGTFFHGGDARPGEPFREVGRRYDLDLGALAFGSVGRIPDKETGEPTRTKWYSDENEVVEAGAQLELDRLLPTHWDMWRGLTADPSVLTHHVRSFDHPRRLELVGVGDRVDL